MSGDTGPMRCNTSCCFSGIILTGSEGEAGSRKEEAVVPVINENKILNTSHNFRMVKKETVHRLITDKVLPSLEKLLTAYGFKYNKGREAFLKKDREYEMAIVVPKYSGSIEYDDDKELIYLHFTLYTTVEIPNYMKWYEEKFGARNNLSGLVSQIKLFTIVEFSDFSETDFFTPSKGAAFKNYISGQLRNNMNSENKSEFIELAEFILNIDTELEKLEKSCNADNIFKTKEFPVSPNYANYLIYDNQLEKASSQYNQLFDIYKGSLAIEKDPGALKAFEKFIVDAEKLLGIKYVNPFLANFIRSEDKSVKIQLIPGYTYISQLKFEAENSKLREGLYNENTSETFLLLDNNTLFKLNSGGEELFQQKIEISSASNDSLFSRGLTLIQNSNCLIFGKYILTETNQLIDIESLIKCEIKAKEKVNFSIKDAVSLSNNKGYVLLCSYNFRNSVLCHLDKDFNYLTEYYLGPTPLKIIAEKEWAILDNGKHAFFGFNGVKLFELEFGNGNRDISFSNKGEYCVSYGYATKSDLYDLKTLKSRTLWAHPTYIKNYKEILYNDTHHNFDLSIAKFSPDDNYIVGGGYHGKYVAWTVPKFDRIEMIPDKELLPLLNGAEIVDLDGKVFLKNRGYDIRNIQFFNSSNNFITQHGTYNFLWDKSFKNIGRLPIDGRITFISDRHLTQMHENVFTIFKRQ
jgi:hypothetical protein